MQYMSVADAAEETGLTEDQIRYLVRTGRVSGYKVGSAWALDPNEVIREYRPWKFRDRYLELREEQGLTNRQVAERMGIKFESLRKSANRNNCFIPDVDERKVINAINRAVKAGREFTTTGFHGVRGGLVVNEINRRIKNGQVEVVSDEFGLRVYKGVTCT